jgi:hypothetical protein
MDIERLTVNELKLEALIKLLVRKKLITESELEDILEEPSEDDEDMVE